MRIERLFVCEKPGCDRLTDHCPANSDRMILCDRCAEANYWANYRESTQVLVHDRPHGFWGPGAEDRAN